MSSSHEIDVKELLDKVDTGRPVLVLDVRNDDEFANWKIEGRRDFKVAHIPYFDFIEDENAAAELLPKTQSEIVVVCAKGGSSEMVAEMLRNRGLPARSLIGGMIAYGEYLAPFKVPVSEEDRSVCEIWQFNRRGKGCLSYVIVSGGEAMVIDPSRSIEIYEAFLSERDARLAYALDTHVHADHISGGAALAAELNAPYFVSTGVDFDLRQPVNALKDGDLLPCGKTSVRVLAAPGHTPGSVCYLAADHYLLTGDTLFTKSVGRPDLGGHVVAWSEDLFRTLRERLASLPDATLVLPAHYADITEIGPAGVVAATLGELRRDLPELQIDEPGLFTDTMKRMVRTTPATYADIIDVNLGRTQADPDHQVEWELGKNQCAASIKRANRIEGDLGP